MAEKDRSSTFGADGGKQESGKRIVGICAVCGDPVKTSKNSKATLLGTSWFHAPCAVRKTATS